MAAGVGRVGCCDCRRTRTTSRGVTIGHEYVSIYRVHIYIRRNPNDGKQHIPSKLVNRLPEQAASIFCVAVISVSASPTAIHPPPPLPGPDCGRRRRCSLRAVMKSRVPLMVLYLCTLLPSSKGKSRGRSLTVFMVSDGAATIPDNCGGTLWVCDKQTLATAKRRRVQFDAGRRSDSLTHSLLTRALTRARSVCGCVCVCGGRRVRRGVCRRNGNSKARKRGQG